jgi:hypothetical protein
MKKIHLAILVCVIFCQPLRATSILPSYEKVDATIITAEMTSWLGSNAVAQSKMQLFFDRTRGWHAQFSSAEQQRHVWKTSAGCYKNEWYKTYGLAGELKSGTAPVSCQSLPENGLSYFQTDELAANFLRLLLALPDALFNGETCKATPQGFACKSANASALVDVQAGQIKQLQIQRTGHSTIETVQITHSQRAVALSELSPDFKALGVLPGLDEASMLATFQRALGGDKLALRHSMTYLLAVQAPDQLKPSDMFRILEMSYTAKIPGASYASAQMFSKQWRKNLPTDQLKRGEAALVAEFKKRIGEAAINCYPDALSRMQEGCFELDCENEVASEATAMLSYIQTQACEAKQANRFKHLKRPAWANRVLP